MKKTERCFACHQFFAPCVMREWDAPPPAIDHGENLLHNDRVTGRLCPECLELFEKMKKGRI